MKATFQKIIEFPDETSLNIQFTATASMGGIGAYEFWGQKCHESHLELDEVLFDSKDLSEEQKEYLDLIISDGELDDLAYEALAEQNQQRDDDPPEDEEDIA